MVIIVYIGMLLYGVYSGYVSSLDMDNENEVIATMVFIAMLASITVLFFASFVHIFAAFFFWLVVTFAVSEGIKFVRSLR